MSVEIALMLALLAGISIPAGAFASTLPELEEFCRRKEIDSFISYFGGGALMATLSLVLIPRGTQDATVPLAAFAFALGGLLFWRISSWTKRARTSASHLIGMVLNFVPEVILLGVAAATEPNVGYLLAALIALQNMPEGFAARQEMQASGLSRRLLWLMFILVPLLAPFVAAAGFIWMAGSELILPFILLFCSGVILYLVFEDIAPGAHLTRTSFPATGAVMGFLLGMVGTMLIH